MPRLTVKQEKFCLFYWQSGHATNSAIEAGYKPHAAQMMGSENLRKPMIIARLAELAQPLKDDAVATVREIEENLTNITREQSKDKRSKLRAMDMLLKHYNGYPVPQPITNNYNQIAIKVIYDGNEHGSTSRIHSTPEAPTLQPGPD